MTELLVFGAGGHGRVVADVARSCGHTVVAFVVDDDRITETLVAGLPVLAWSAVAATPPAPAIALGIGDNASRAGSAARATAAGLEVVTLVHARSVVSPSARLGRGVVVMAGAVVNADARIGDGAVVNTGSVVEHDCVIGRFALVGPGCALGGGATVGDQALVGVGASLRPGVHVGARAVIGAGAVVVSDIGDGVAAVGIPARPSPPVTSAGGSPRA